MTRRIDRPRRFESVTLVIAAIAILVGIVLAFVTSPIDGIMVGLLTEILLETLNSSYKERQYELRLSALANVPRGADVTTKLAETGLALHSAPHAELLRGELLLRLADLEGHLDHLVRGRVVRDGSDIRDMLEQTARCRTDLKAMTTVRADASGRDEDWWNSRLGQTYWESNLAALSRGVSISRIFIVDELTPDVTDLMKKQAAAGVTVRHVTYDDLPLNLRVNMIVWDSDIAWRAHMGTAGDITGNRLYTRPVDVRQIEGYFQAAHERSTLFPAP